MRTSNPRTNIQVSIQPQPGFGGKYHTFQYVERVHTVDAELVVKYAPPEGTYEVLEERFDAKTMELCEVTTVEQPPR
jgi:hypothetical protein